MSDQYLYVKFSDGSLFSISAKVIATDRAHYYAQLDVEHGGAADYTTAFLEECKYALSDHTELIDWAQNNMDWNDVFHSAVREDVNEANRQKEWPNAWMVVDDSADSARKRMRS